MTATELPRPDANWALFLDFDGTLTDIAVTPGAVRVDPDLPATLAKLQGGLGGAVAIISGRPLAQIDAMLAPVVLPAAGLHGLEWRDQRGRVERPEAEPAALAPMRRMLAEFAAANPGVELEDKTHTLALHYRAAPRLAGECRRAVQAAAAGTDGAFHVLEGKMVFEIKPAGIDKGTAIERFLAAPPFAARRPVFIGDDTTDEDGFAAVNRHWGITVRVGDGQPTAARYRIAAVADLLAWLADIAAELAPQAAR